MVKFIW